MKKRFILMSVILGWGISASYVYAKEGKPFETDSFKWGFDFRVRQVYFDNIIDMDEEKDDGNRFFRFRPRIWAKFLPSENIEIYTRLTDEFREYYDPDVDFEINEVVIDNLYIQLKNLMDDHLTLKLGRQDIILGDGFIILDGSPFDGSRTIYHNALRAILKSGKWTVDSMGIFNRKEDETVFINSQDKQLCEWDETVGGANISYAYKDKKEITGYYFY